nr:MAG TPA: hypothetical protein [Caudoviricetes sp.]
MKYSEGRMCKKEFNIGPHDRYRTLIKMFIAVNYYV